MRAAIRKVFRNAYRDFSEDLRPFRRKFRIPAGLNIWKL